VGELKCSKEELDEHLGRTYGDPQRGAPLGLLDDLPDMIDKAGSPSFPFMMTNITRREHDEVIKKARSKVPQGIMV
jgi:hypothetical protein